MHQVIFHLVCHCPLSNRAELIIHAVVSESQYIMFTFSLNFKEPKYLWQKIDILHTLKEYIFYFSIM
jgi:hypothetical protein